jgi:hypothetical protein
VYNDTLETEVGALRSVPVQFVSLQKDRGIDSAEAQKTGLDLVDPMADVTDFSDTAAIVSALDSVIAVDTSVAHLAAAVGCPVFLLSRYDACWRWLRDRTDTPWYPEMRVFRQERPGDWSGVLARVAAALQQSDSSGVQGGETNEKSR